MGYGNDSRQNGFIRILRTWTGGWPPGAGYESPWTSFGAVLPTPFWDPQGGFSGARGGQGSPRRSQAALCMHQWYRRRVTNGTQDPDEPERTRPPRHTWRAS